MKHCACTERLASMKGSIEHIRPDRIPYSEGDDRICYKQFRGKESGFLHNSKQQVKNKLNVFLKNLKSTPGFLHYRCICSQFKEVRERRKDFRGQRAQLRRCNSQDFQLRHIGKQILGQRLQAAPVYLAEAKRREAPTRRHICESNGVKVCNERKLLRTGRGGMQRGVM